MSPETAEQLVWFGKVFQLIAAIILTPEIIGPDRFDKLEKSLEAWDSDDIRTLVVRLMSVLGILYGLSSIAITYLALRTLDRHGLYASACFPVTLGILLSFGIASGILMDRSGVAFFRSTHKALAKLVSYLRRVSLFRTLAVITAVFLFFLGVGIELFVEWPF